MVAFTAFCATTLFIQLATIAITIQRVLKRRAVSEASKTISPPVTILRPVCGLENNLEATLESAFQLDWPTEIEILFCVASSTDAAVPLVEKLMNRHPNIEARLLVGDDRVSINPKLNNLVKGWKSARHDWIVMADSNVLMPADYLSLLFERMTPGTGMVCSPPVGSAPEGFAAELECAWLNSFQARWQLLADEIGMGFAQGKTMLVNRHLIDNAGGIERLADEVAEDAASTKIVRATGLSVRLVERPFAQPLGQRDFASIWRRQLRWARLRRVSFPLFFVPELFSGGFFPIATTLALTLASDWSAWSMLAYVTLWYGAELLLIRAYRWPLSIKTPGAIMLRDLALPALWTAAWFGNGFVWRGNQMAVEQHHGAGTAAVRLRHAYERTRAKARIMAAHWR